METNEPCINHAKMMEHITALLEQAITYATSGWKAETCRVKRHSRDASSSTVGKVPVYYIGATPHYEWYCVEVKPGAYELGRRRATLLASIVIEDWDFWSYHHDVSLEAIHGLCTRVQEVNRQLAATSPQST